jgi:hypothetical protein
MIIHQKKYYDRDIKSVAFIISSLRGAFGNYLDIVQYVKNSEFGILINDNNIIFKTYTLRVAFMT